MSAPFAMPKYFKYAFLLILLNVTCRIWASEDVGSQPMTEVDSEARQILRTLGYGQRYLAEQKDFLDYFEKQPRVTKEFIEIFKDVQGKQDYEGELVKVVRMFWTAEDSKNINQYLSVGVGKKEAEYILNLIVRIKKGKARREDINIERDKFLGSLSSEEREARTEFGNSESGKRYWSATGDIQDKVYPVFQKLRSEAIKRASAIMEENKKKILPQPLIGEPKKSASQEGITWSYDPQTEIYTNDQTKISFPKTISGYEQNQAVPVDEQGRGAFSYAGKGGIVTVYLAHRRVHGLQGSDDCSSHFREIVQDGMYATHGRTDMEELFSFAFTRGGKVLKGVGLTVHFVSSPELGGSAYSEFGSVLVGHFLYYYQAYCPQKNGLEELAGFLQEVGFKEKVRQSPEPMPTAATPPAGAGKGDHGLTINSDGTGKR